MEGRDGGTIEHCLYYHKPQNILYISVQKNTLHIIIKTDEETHPFIHLQWKSISHNCNKHRTWIQLKFTTKTAHDVFIQHIILPRGKSLTGKKLCQDNISHFQQQMNWMKRVPEWINHPHIILCKTTLRY